jgi:hypothetical protein
MSQGMNADPFVASVDTRSGKVEGTRQHYRYREQDSENKRENYIVER